MEFKSQMNKIGVLFRTTKKGLLKEKIPFSKLIKKYGKRLNCSKVTCSFSNWVYNTICRIRK